MENSPFKTPPSGNLSILEHLVTSYKLWHEIKNHIQKSSRYTLGEKIDILFMETLELIFIAQYLSKIQKLPALQKANTKFDALKFFLKILWEIKAIENKHFILVSEQLNKVGRMLGGWLKKLEAEAPRDTINRARPNN